MDTISLWKAISKNPVVYPELTQHIEVDVAIIGAGITGITTALQLMNAGKKVAVLEAHEVGGETTSFSSSNLYIAVQPYYQKVVKKFGLPVAKTVAHSRKFAIEYIAKIIREKNINCHFARRPWYLYTDDDKKLAFLAKEVETFKQMDIDIHFTKNLPLPFKFKKAAVIQNQARFNCLQYVMDLAADLHQKGCQIFANTHVTGIEEKDICTIKTKKGRVTAKKVVIATHTPIGIHAVQAFTAPYRSYVVAAHLKDNIYPEGHFWDLGKPHHATCTHSINNPHPEILMVAGNHHKVGQETDTKKHYEGLQTFLRQHFAITDFPYQWSAQHYHSADTLPYIGFASRFAKHTYMATGYFADGLIYGTLAGIILSDLILEKNAELAKIYKANRFKPCASSPFLITQNTNVFLQYLKDYPLFSKPNVENIKMGEGKIVEINREKWAVSRDDKNQLHMVSAVCTHMKCIVNWNNAQKTWDCPCHGSRFTCDGKVIEGPAIRNLKSKEIEKC